MEYGICLILENKEYEIINDIMDLKDDYIGENQYAKFYGYLYDDKKMLVNCDLYYPYFSEEESLLSNRLKIKKIAKTFDEKKQFLAEFIPLDKILNETMLYYHSYPCPCNGASYEDKLRKMTEDVHSLINEYFKQGKEFVIDNVNYSFGCDNDTAFKKEKYLYEMIRYMLDINMKINPLYGDRFIRLIHSIIKNEYYCIAIDLLNAIEKNKLQSILSDGLMCYDFCKRLITKIEENESLKEDSNVMALLKMFYPSNVIDKK